MIELVILVFIVSFMGSMIVRMTVQRRNDKVINQLHTENELLRRGYNNGANNYNNNRHNYAVYDSNGKRVN